MKVSSDYGVGISNLIHCTVTWSGLIIVCHVSHKQWLFNFELDGEHVHVIYLVFQSDGEEGFLLFP